MKSFIESASGRYSVRKFDSRQVEEEKIDLILEAGMKAPTAVNLQPVKVWVVQSNEARAKLNQTTPFPFVKQAQVVFVVGSDPRSAWVRHFDNKNYADIDASIVATHMMLEIHDLGLGTTWVGHFDADKLKSMFPEMKPYNLIAMFPVGYPAEDSAPSKTHAVSKSKDEFTKIL